MHYWAIHRKVTNREWRNLDQRSRDIVASDTAQTSQAFREFEGRVNSETERLYNDPAYYMNDPQSFKYGKHEDMVETLRSKNNNN